MLLIFDLDDTLIDTSGCVTPYKLEKALEAMLGHPPQKSQLDKLLQANEQLAKSSAALEFFAKEQALSSEALQRGLQVMTTPLPDTFQVVCTPHAKEILEECRAICPIALVTAGYAPFQLDKLKKAGIEASIFSKINIPEDSAKKSYYQELAKEFSTSPSNVWVCGDRIAVDLKPAHELGFRTIHMRWGRGKRVKPETEQTLWIDYQITSLTELRNIIR